MEQPVYYQTSYQRASCQIGVVHIGFGAFHRAHQAVYFDDYMQESHDLNWGIAAININPDDSHMVKKPDNSHAGYMLKTIHTTGEDRYRLVRSHLALMDWPTQKNEAERRGG